MRPALALALACLVAAPAQAKPRKPAPPVSEADSGDNLVEIAAAFGRKQKWDRAVELLAEAHAAHPADADVLEELVVACFHAESCAPRRTALLREAAKLPNPGDLTDELTELSETWMHEEKWEQAVALLDGLRALSGSPDVLEDLIEACQKAASCAPRRLQLLREGVQKLPQPGELVDEYAEALFKTLPAKDAVAELRALAARRPGDDRIDEALVDAAVDHELYEVVVAELPRFLARHPKDVERRIAYVEALKETHRDFEFRKQLDELQRLHPGNLMALALKTESRIDRGELKAARLELERLRALAKTDDERARVRELEGRVHEEREELRRDFRREVGWLDLADDLEREQDRDP